MGGFLQSRKKNNKSLIKTGKRNGWTVLAQLGKLKTGIGERRLLPSNQGCAPCKALEKHQHRQSEQGTVTSF